MSHIQPLKNWKLPTARAAWLGLIVLTLAWDGLYAPLHTGRWLLVIKLLPLCLPLQGILSGRIYTYQYCSMLILAYFTEGVMRLFDVSIISVGFAIGEILLSVLFFVACLAYLKQFKHPKKGD
ncbi:MAG: DUF2069 domain-containing protein [Alysiella sp.]|uniref:DUF2069 domain-containing protein n=1 Tax=Alysiella sp. TaxID=1872483 RepID=UPI0026DB4336|nr:DUF2069 domain-containing protein [Alysiella sp.]MDO4433240.1 DUF2069 domain-containing protein [Alysiella sp.]